MILNSFVIDALTVVIVMLFAFISYKKGFASSLVSLMGAAVSIIAAIVISKVGAALIYEMFLRDNLRDLISQSLTSTEAEAAVLKIIEAVQELPKYIVNMIEFETGGISYEIKKLAGESTQVMLEAVMGIAGPIIKMALRGFLFIAVFIICRIVVSIIAFCTKMVRKIPLVGSLDGILGFVFGILKGSLFMFVLGNALMFLLKISNNSLPLISIEAVSASKIFSVFVSLGNTMGI